MERTVVLDFLLQRGFERGNLGISRLRACRERLTD
jgi:hypothetical protein